MKKTIVITGGNDGLGKTLAENLAKNNNVIIISITLTKKIMYVPSVVIFIPK